MTRPASVYALVCALLTCLLLTGCAQAGGAGPVATDHRASRATRPSVTPTPPPDAPGTFSASTGMAIPPSTVAAWPDGTPRASSTAAAARDEISTWESGKVFPITVHFVHRSGGQLYLVPERRQAAAGATAMESAARLALSEQPTWPGPANPFPRGTRLLGFTLGDGTATLNLSSEVLSWEGPPDEADYAIQALAHTLASAGDVGRVRIQVEGHTGGLLAGRDLTKLWGGLAITRPAVPDPAVRLAPITLTTPRPRTAVAGDRLWVQGEASTLDGIVSLRLRDENDKVAAQNFTTAEQTAPRRGPFSGSLPFKAPDHPATWTLEVFATNPADGSTTYQVDVPVAVGG
jgi:Immunoglobulin-like domain of bacterial spore germination/Sporulation and spore germination